MRKLAVVWVSGVVIFAGVVLALVSCSVDPSVKRSESVTVAPDGSKITEVTFKGHEYLAFKNGTGGSLCHSETCPCKSSK